MTKSFLFESELLRQDLEVFLIVTCRDTLGDTVHFDIEAICDQARAPVTLGSLPLDEQKRLYKQAGDVAWDARHDALTEYRDTYADYLADRAYDDRMEEP